MKKTANKPTVTIAIACLLLGSALNAAETPLVPWSEQHSVLNNTDELPRGTLDRKQLDELTQTGEALFTAKFTRPDGAGRPAATQAIIPTKAKHALLQDLARLPGPDSGACSSCHNEPVVGGAGDFVTNVFVSEGFANANFDTSDPQFSNERGTNHLFGSGLVELLAREMSADLTGLRAKALRQAAAIGQRIRLPLSTKGVSFGFITALPDGLVDLKEIEGIDTDLVVRPFSQKGVMTSLRQFTVNALNHHHGMQPTERFGARWTGETDFDEDGHANEMGDAAISALVAWQATLPVPTVRVPLSVEWQEAAARGEVVFDQMGCASCHVRALPLKSLAFADPGPLDAAGTLNQRQVQEPAVYDLGLFDWAARLPRNEKGEVLVPLFGDLKRHKMTDRKIDALGNELLSQRFVGRDIFMTAELWGIGSTAPYGHRNDFSTLDEIILAHGGDGREARDAYEKASDDDKSALIAWLRTLVIEP